MICTNCGAPMAPGETECPYCRAKIVPQSRQQGFGEETAFAENDDNEYTVENEEATEFAPPQQIPVMQPESEETEFAAPVRAEIPTPQTRKVPREKTQARKQKPQKQRKHKDEDNTAEKADKKTMLIRGALIAVLVVLIVVAFLR